MKHSNNLINIFKNLLDSYTYIDKSQYNDYIAKLNNREYCFVQFCINGNVLCVHKTQEIQYRQAIKQIFSKIDKKTINKIYEKMFLDKLHEFVSKYYVEEKTLNENDIKDFYAFFANIKESHFKVLSVLHGFELPQDINSIEVGNFIICNYKYINGEYLNKHPQYKFNSDFIAPSSRGLIDYFYVIHKDIHAYDNNKAVEIFQEKIENLINFLFYCISIKSKDNSKISYTKDFSNKKIFVITPDLIQSTFSRNDITNPLYIVTPDLFEVKYKNILLNNLKIINNLETDNLCEIEQKINRAVNWIGQSLRNDDLTQSFLFLAMAMECLLTYNEGFISPSITYQLAETCAFLCADTLEERIQIEKTIKDLYRKRSAIVHSGGTDISLQDYYSFIPILKITIGKLLELVENFNIKKPDDLCQYIKKCKYD